MKKLMPLALLAAAAFVIWKFIMSRAGSGATAQPGDNFWSAGNRQAGESWWNISEWLRGGGPQRNNPVTGNPIPDATIYPTDPYPIQTASVPSGQMGIEPWLTRRPDGKEPALGQVVTIQPYMPGMPGGYPKRRLPTLPGLPPGQVITMLPYMPGMPGGYPITPGMPGVRYPITLPVQPRPFI